MLASPVVPRSIWDISVTDITGHVTTLDRFRGHVLLIVNVASRCGYTPQYRGLEARYRRHRDAGLVVLGFPCNQFGNQEPGAEPEIAEFCSLTYDVTFPMFARVDVNGPGTHPLYEFLKTRKKGLLGTEGIKWNFTKFLVDRTGRVVGRFGPTDTPESIEPAIVAALAK
ncbi:MAG: glutathione peroxidase [Acidobacteria bacterium]|nr:glutathione peroxidase [Acidobacteriota bacterium]